MSALVVLLTTRIAQLAAINLVALGLIVAGLAVFGLAPALVACLWAAARLDTHGTRSLVVGMVAQYRAEFIRANLVAGPGLAAAAALLWMAVAGGGILAPIWLACGILAGLHAVAALLTIAHLSGTIGDGFANAATALVLGSHRMLAVLGAVPLIGLAVLWQPLLGLYFAVSGWALLATLVALPALASAMPNAPKPTEVSP